jgi:predicted xylose isomerase-like sugar epimerase
VKKDTIKIGIMGGRLSKPIGDQIQAFPVDSWRDEFEKAQHCGFDTIEWVFDLYPNPILHDEGVQEIRSLSKKYGIKVDAVCADYFMRRMIFNVAESDLEQNLSILHKLILQCSKLEIQLL